MTKYIATQGSKKIEFQGKCYRAAAYAASLEMSGWKVTKV